MSESPIPPPLPPVAKSNTGVWWFVWILCTVIVPGAPLILDKLPPGGDGRAVVCILAILAMPIFHIISSIKLSQGGSGWLRFALIFGGWVLMLACSFVGCFVIISPSR